MILGENIGSVYSKGREIQRVFSKGKLVWEKKNNDDIDYSIIPFTVKAVADNVSVKLSGDYGTSINYKYSINGGSWIETDESTTINIKKDDTVSYKGADIYRCEIEGLSDIYGNIMSLQYEDNFIGQTVWLLNGSRGCFESSDIRNAHNLILPATTLAEDCYYRMFEGCTSLTSAPELPAITLAEDCYNRMFYDCTSLTTAPELPATTLADGCYMYMFYGCKALTSAPELPATTLAEDCYMYMFLGCTSLTSAPELPATTLTPYCYYQMFTNCTSLTSAPELPATTLIICCYLGMFLGCTSLTSAPELPATTLAYECYHLMFWGCTSLTSAPELPAITLAQGCYRNMFAGCTLINYIKCYATNNIEESNVSGWTNGISTNGKLLCKSINGGKNPLEEYIPSTWSVEYFT